MNDCAGFAVILPDGRNPAMLPKVQPVSPEENRLHVFLNLTHRYGQESMTDGMWDS